MASTGSFLSELKRRRVFRVLAGYCAAALVAIEAANDIFPALDLPVWTVRLVVVLAILGLPVALCLAWAFDVTPEGLQRTPGLPGTPLVRRRVALYAAAAAVLAVGGGVAYGRFRHGGAGRAGPEAGVSVAVLPFVNLTGDPSNEYFSDGVTEEILDALSNVPGLRVPARTSSFAFKGKPGDVTAIGRQLRVTHVLEGSVQRAGNRVRITAQLVDARSGYHQWSQVYTLELKDVFAAEDELSREIARQLELRLDPRVRLARGGTGDPQAHDLYLQGRALLFAPTDSAGEWKRNLMEAITVFHRALTADSTYALAWSGIAFAYSRLADDFWPPRDAYPRAREAVLRAVALQPDLAEVRIALAEVLYFHDWNYAAGDREVRLALSLDPENASAHALLAWRYTAERRFADARREAGTAARLDPANPGRSYQLLTTRGMAGEARHLLDSLHAAAAARPGDMSAKFSFFYVAFWSAQWKEAASMLTVLRREAPRWYHPSNPNVALVWAKAGNTAEARSSLDSVVAYARDHYVRASTVAAGYAALGERDTAARWLERAYRERDGGLLELGAWDWWDALREDPRFEAIRRRVPTAPAWR